ncbi:MAG: adenylyl-sulfate kinase [Bacteroidota bacterium]
MTENSEAVGRIGRNEKEGLLGQQALAVWFTGLSGSGKSTLASLLDKILFQNGIKVALLDGDDLRSGINSDLGFSEGDRTENLRRAAHMARACMDAGLVVLCSFISPLETQRRLIHEIVGSSFVEIYVKCSPEECERRDTKGLYKRARRGEIRNFTGISSPYEIPENPDMVIDTEHYSPEACAEKIWQIVRSRVIAGA